MDNTVSIEFHADDYGLFPAQSQRILDCHRQGCLNGVSIMPNSPYLSQFMKALEPYRDQIALTVHLNLIEGASLCGHEEVPLLTDASGVLCSSFFGLCLHSFLPDRERYRCQLKKELRRQIQAVRSHLEPGAPLRLDGHAHYHMIPVVFDALMDVITEDRLPVSYIRIPREYPRLYLRHLKQLQDVSPVNFLKVFILNLFARRAERKYGSQLASYCPTLFLGVFLSGRMHQENVAQILPDALALARSKGIGVEILAHPGGVTEPSDIAQITCKDDLHFLTSPFREQEATLFTMDTQFSPF